MNVRIKEDVWKLIYAGIRETEPNECFAYLLGRYTKSYIDITNIYFAQVAKRTTMGVDVSDKRNDIIEESLENIVGVFHSHPDTDPVRSSYDIETSEKDKVELISTITPSDIIWSHLYYFNKETHRWRRKVLKW